MAFSSLTNKIVYAASGNFSVGSRNGVKGVTLHHAVNTSADATAATFAKAGRNGSCNYAVDSNQIIGIVDEKNTAWCDSNWDSNTKHLSIEMSNSSIAYPYPVLDATYDRTARLVADIFKRYGIKSAVLNSTIFFHRWFTSTQCPGDYSYDRRQALCDRINAYLNPAPEKPHWVPMENPGSYTVNKNPTNLWNIPSYSSASTYAEGTQIDNLVEKATMSNGQTYLRTQYSKDHGFDRGFNVVDMVAVPEVPPTPPEPEAPDPAEPTPDPVPEQPSVPDPGEIEGQPADEIDWSGLIDKINQTVEASAELITAVVPKGFIKMNSKVYDVLKWIGRLLLPALGVFYTALAGIWNLPFAHEITGSCAALALFLNAILEVSNAQYQAVDQVTKANS